MKFEYRIEHNPAKDDYRLMVKFEGVGWREHKFRRPSCSLKDSNGPIPYVETYRLAAINEVHRLAEELYPKKDSWGVVHEGWVDHAIED